MDILLGMSVLLLVSISCMHVYWAFGGKWGGSVVIPTDESQQPTFVPGTLATLLVAFLLLGAALLLMARAGIFLSISSHPLVKWGCWICMAVFGLRSVGDGRYVGLFKRMKHTRFSTYDTYLFTPICLWLCFSFLYAISR
ncbi:DUF3995 domain-containing protein [Brevibacillus sp. 7WMA2]|uniref:DUF3995 domain-containing protein n=1 Tax=Brevibacillus TaxID=55080 RepID=UPI0013A755E0|nr:MULTISPECIES: DUF3995 domain-containing protein [Brevibacillus]MCR8963373.1 DUF3995 domain-containing protein [Brevibacillus laterosporus]MCR8995542.1 DUF3995 domain-containing protein [Brevibacillus laterosporus]MCZ0835529.1 DUF3995 domain-containing protein [Brevibacillus halotolerans]QIC06042.1 DUF3995 domain-containing protein [Brevibacillus sp. 7WMA2]WPS86975.1 DUF3995 domain-containing protein [Brevibacillus halotolerans]